jgi:hypothetical protein
MKKQIREVLSKYRGNQGYTMEHAESEILNLFSVSGWHFLPEMPEVNKEVLVAIKYDNEPVQAYWTGKEWKGSLLVRDNMVDGYVGNESFKHFQEWIYAWIELPQVPPIPEPF